MTKQKLSTRTKITLALVILSAAALAAVASKFAQYWPSYYGNNQAVNNQANNQAAASIQLETTQSQYQIGDEVLLK